MDIFSLITQHIIDVHIAIYGEQCKKRGWDGMAGARQVDSMYAYDNSILKFQLYDENRIQ